MKKTLSIILAALVVMSCVFAFAGCKDKNTDDTTANASNTSDVVDDNKDADESDFEYIKAKGKIVIGCTEYAPIYYKDEAGNYTGFDYDYAQAVSKKLGIPVEFLEIDWDNKEFELKDKKVDLIWNGMTITDELKKSMDIADAYAKNEQVVVMNADKVADYKDKESLKGLKFAVEVGSAGKNVAEDNGFEYIEVGAQSDTLLEVKSGKADACIIDIAMAKSMVGEGTSYDTLAMGISLQKEEFGIGCRKGSDMVEKLNAVTDELVADGTLQQIADKYGMVLAD